MQSTLFHRAAVGLTSLMISGMAVASDWTERSNENLRPGVTGVSQEVYDARTIERLSGGFVVDYGETAEVVFSQAGVHYYICEPHVTMDMIGTITVE